MNPNLRAILTWAKTTVEETPNVVSSMRVVMLGGTTLIFAAWLWACHRSHSLLPFDSTHLAMVALLIGGKVGQHFSE